MQQRVEGWGFFRVARVAPTSSNAKIATWQATEMIIADVRRRARECWAEMARPPAGQTVWQTADSLRTPSDERADSSSSRDLSVKSTTESRGRAALWRLMLTSDPSDEILRSDDYPKERR